MSGPDFTLPEDSGRRARFGTAAAMVACRVEGRAGDADVLAEALTDECANAVELSITLGTLMHELAEVLDQATDGEAGRILRDMASAAALTPTGAEVGELDALEQQWRDELDDRVARCHVAGVDCPDPECTWCYPHGMEVD